MCNVQCVSTWSPLPWTINNQAPPQVPPQVPPQAPPPAQLITQSDVEKELLARARTRGGGGEHVVLNDRVIACYISVVVIIIAVLILVIVVLSVLDNHKYKIF